jgi:hypothetical protein
VRYDPIPFYVLAPGGIIARPRYVQHLCCGAWLSVDSRDAVPYIITRAGVENAATTLWGLFDTGPPVVVAHDPVDFSIPAHVHRLALAGPDGRVVVRRRRPPFDLPDGLYVIHEVS